MELLIHQIIELRFNIHEPFRDFYSLAKVCREMEQKYSLVVDNGMEKGEPTRVKLCRA
jgi:hypothetical protein